jgi:MFS family permease
LPFLISIFSLKPVAPHRHLPYHHSFKLPFGEWWKNIDIRNVTWNRFILEAFFTIIVAWSPIYLTKIMGFSWPEVGIMFTVALLPFVLLEWPVGEFADRWWGEKEMMATGFLITGLSLLIMPFLGKVFWAWMLVLFISRIGASLVEATTESYFFKKINSSETGFLSIFRLTRAMGVICGISIGFLTLLFFSYEKIFFAMAIVIFFGLKESFRLKDTL